VASKDGKQLLLKGSGDDELGSGRLDGYANVTFVFQDNQHFETQGTQVA
jgi:hypothetical protein